MADQIATRFGLLDRDLSHAALQTIVLTAADAIDALDDAHHKLRRIGVPDPQAAQQAPRQRWEQLLRNLFPAPIMVVNPHGNASPELATLPAGSDEAERSVRRLLNAAAAFLLAETTTLDDAVDSGYQRTVSTTAGAEEDLDTVEALLIAASRASRTLLDHAESGQWRDLLASFVPLPDAATETVRTRPEHLQDLVTRFMQPDAGTGNTRTRLQQLRDQLWNLLPPATLPRPIILFLGTGSGKTFTALTAYQVFSPFRNRLRGWSGWTRSRLATDPFAPVDVLALRCAETLDDHGLTLPTRCVTRDALVTHDWDSAAFERVLARHIFTQKTIHSLWTARDRATWSPLHHGDLRTEHVLDWAWPPALVLVDFGVSKADPIRSSPVEETDQVFGMSRSLLSAAERLGSHDAYARMAGLAHLEAFGQSNPDQRQAVVNVLCGYLRTPAPEVERGHNEWRVRAAVQATLADHLRPGPNPAHPPDTYWPGLDLDLDNAILLDLDLAGCDVRSARFTGARFYGDTSFTNMRVGCSLFDEAEFIGDVVFTRASFTDEVRFLRTSFRGDAVFTGAQFDRDCRFDAALFDGYAVFTRSAFNEDARFHDTTFSGDAVFDEARFAGLARFGHARFLAGARFHATRFHRDHDGSRTLDLDGVLLAQAPGWVRTDTSTAAAPRRVWPAGWTVRPTRDQPRGEDVGQWGRLVPELPAAV